MNLQEKNTVRYRSKNPEAKRLTMEAGEFQGISEQKADKIQTEGFKLVPTGFTTASGN
jgi:hypothetical protein